MKGPEEYVQVPLVIYVDGVRHVVGEATVKGSEIHAVMDERKSEAVMDWLFKQEKNEFSLSYGEGEATIIDRNEKVLGPMEFYGLHVPPGWKP